MTAPTPSVIWVVGDGEGDVLHSTTDKDVADEHFQMCVDEPNDFRSGPYTLTEYVPKRDLAAREAELAAMKQAKERAEYLLGCESRYLAASRDALKAAHEALKAAEVTRDEWIDTAMAALDRAQRAEHGRDEWKRKAEESARDAGRWAQYLTMSDSEEIAAATWVGQSEITKTVDAAIAAKGEA